MKIISSGKILVLVAINAFIAGSCSSSDDEISYDLTGNWKVSYYVDKGEKITKADKNTWPDFNDGDITANFSEPDIHGKGTISGIRVTNSYNGEYTLDTNGKIGIGPISTTFINEPEWTDLYKISAAQNCEIRNSKLFIYYNEGQNMIVFERK